MHVSQIKKCLWAYFFIVFFFQFILPAIVHINHQPYLERGDGPIVSISFASCALIFSTHTFVNMIQSPEVSRREQHTQQHGTVANILHTDTSSTPG